jgi:hypothetical protein
MTTGSGWAEEEFGSVDLGDRRRNRRLVAVAREVAERPSGKVTSVFRTSATREGAFRLIENEAVDPQAIARASYEATARRAAQHEFVFVAVDGSSLNITDDARSKGTGVVGSWRVGARGFHVMTALAVGPEGTPLGLCGQEFWSRVERSTRNRRKGVRKDKRPIEDKETVHWLRVMHQVREIFRPDIGPKPWFQLDRGGDAWPVILDGLEPGQLFTVRAVHDRRLKLDSPEAGERRYLRETLEKQPVIAEKELDLPASGGRRARRAIIQIRAREVTLDFLVGSKRRTFASLWALMARESDATVPSGERPIEWLLLTSHPISSPADAEMVLFGYSQRWRIEEFHRLWKSGACRVEDTQLRDRDHIIRWATILAAVAVRILRMTYLSRKTPDLPADVEFTAAEVKAIILARRPAESPRSPSIAQIVQWLAELGGYTGKSSGGPPGPLVLARGLQSIQLLAEVVERTDQW